MKILYEYPPNIDKIREVFPLHKGVIFTYGDTIYNPDKGKITSELIKHEETHEKQQGNNIDEWWNKYLNDKKFRLEQEIEAYRNQYKYILENYNRQMRKLLLKDIAKHLSSAMYGYLISEEDATEIIKKVVNDN